MKQRFRPHRSVSLLHGIISTAMITRNSVIVICTPCTVVFRSLLMSLIITFMFEPAKLQMNCARASGSTSRRAAREWAAGICVVAAVEVEATTRVWRGRGGTASPDEDDDPLAEHPRPGERIGSARATDRRRRPPADRDELAQARPRTPDRRALLPHARGLGEARRGGRLEGRGRRT